MFINKKQKGYGWYSKISSKDLDTNKEITDYLNFSFKRDCEPNTEVLEGDLYFIDKQGVKRKVFPIAKEYNDRKYIEFKILEYEGTSKMGGNRSNSAQNVISKDELPFY